MLIRDYKKQHRQRTHKELKGIARLTTDQQRSLRGYSEKGS